MEEESNFSLIQAVFTGLAFTSKCVAIIQGCSDCLVNRSVTTSVHINNSQKQKHSSGDTDESSILENILLFISLQVSVEHHDARTRTTAYYGVNRQSRWKLKKLSPTMDFIIYRLNYWRHHDMNYHRSDKNEKSQLPEFNFVITRSVTICFARRYFRRNLSVK